MYDIGPLDVDYTDPFGLAEARVEGSALEELVITDTIGYRFEPLPPCCKVISIAALFAEAILLIHRRESVSRLFDFERADGAIA